MNAPVYNQDDNRSFPLSILYVFVILSGMAALSWEVIWQIKSSLALGVSSWGTAVTLAATMGGMSLGALITGKILAHKALLKPLKTYGFLEIIIGLHGLFIGFLFLNLEVLDSYVYTHNPDMATMVHIVGIALALIIPTFAMGATIPVLGLIAKKYKLSLAALYGFNTFGAATGILLAAFLWIPLLGVLKASWIFAIINIAVGFAAFWMCKKTPSESLGVRSYEMEQKHIKTFGFKKSLLIVFFTGFCTFMLEVAWFRSMTAAFFSTTNAFAIMLASVLTALSIGAVYAPILKRRGVNLGAVLCWSGILILFITPVVERFDLFMYSSTQYPLILFARWFFLTLYIVGAPVILLGVALPWLLDEQTDTKKWGALYGVNALAAILGSIVAAWVLLPAIGFAKTSWLTGLMIAGLGFFVMNAYPKKKALICLMVASIFCAVLFESGVGVKRVQGSAVSMVGAEDAQLLKSYEGPDSTISVVGYGDEKRVLFIDGFVTTIQTGDNLIEHYMPWMGYLPMMAHPDPKEALVICFGTGQTANAVRKSGVQNLDIVDLNENVFKLADYFPANESVLKDEKVNSIVMDGRAYIRRANKKYDVITLEPMPPHFAGVNALYSKEFYEFAKNNMTENGVIAQWLPLHLVPPYYSESIAKTFQSVFPNAVLWVDISTTAILLGSVNENLDLKNAWPQYQKNRELSDLSLDEIKRAVLLDKDDLRKYAQSGNLVTDDNQILAYGKAAYQSHSFNSSNTINNFELINDVKPFDWDSIWDKGTPRADYMFDQDK